MTGLTFSTPVIPRLLYDTVRLGVTLLSAGQEAVILHGARLNYPAKFVIHMQTQRTTKFETKTRPHFQ